jgi:dipeptidyl aminopeptidase/acylaminoacyl peptidase
MINRWIGCTFFAALIAMDSVLGYAEPLITPEKALDYRLAADLHFSPDGTALAFIVRTYRDDYASHIWLVDVTSGAARDITPPEKSERLPQWSPDGQTLGFLSNRTGKVQVYGVPAAGGEPIPITAQKNGVTSFHWSPDGRMIAYLAKDDDAPDEESVPHLADDARNLAHLWLMDIASKKPRSLGQAGFRIDEFQWQNAAHILAVATDMPRIEESNTALYSISIRDATFTPIAHPPQPFDSLAVSPNGQEFSVRASGANGPLERDLFVSALGHNTLRSVSAPPDLAVAETRWHTQSAIWARVVDGFFNRLYRLGDAAALRIDLPVSIQSFDVSRDGRVAFAGGDFEHLSEVYIRDTKGTVRQLTHLQQFWNGIPLASTTIFHTKSFDDTDIEAALMKPRPTGSGEKHALVLLVHGGPSSNFAAGYSWDTAWAQMLVSHGYEVLLVNPRGSNGYSEKFLEANRGDWGGADFKDLMAVLDAVIARGETDPDRLGIGGWSYGGEMAAWAITQSSRFKAAVVGAGVFDQAAEFATEHNPAGDEWYFGTPWEHPDVFARNSPSTYIRNAHTPTLILDGEDDASNPVGQSKGLYRALKHFGVETQMVLYPDEGHSPRRWSSNVDMFTRILEWYDRHLQGAR